MLPVRVEFESPEQRAAFLVHGGENQSVPVVGPFRCSEDVTGLQPTDDTEVTAGKRRKGHGERGVDASHRGGDLDDPGGKTGGTGRFLDFSLEESLILRPPLRSVWEFLAGSFS